MENQDTNDALSYKINNDSKRKVCEDQVFGIISVEIEDDKSVYSDCKITQTGEKRTESEMKQIEIYPQVDFVKTVFDVKSSNQNVRIFSDNNSNQSENGEEQTHKLKSIKTRKRICIVDSESDEDIAQYDSKNCRDPSILKLDIEENTRQNKMHNTKQNFLQSDSESEVEENNVTLHDKSFSDEIDINIMTNFVPESIQNSKWSDPDSSDSFEEESSLLHENLKVYDNYINEDFDSKHVSENTEVETKQITAKEAAEQMKEILSESQRRVREKNISLPYHKPKPHNIKDFLSRRPKLASAVQLPRKTPPSLAIKMSTEQLAIISKKIKEREGKLKEFYKSESESEDECEEPKSSQKIYLANEETVSNDKHNQKDICKQSNIKTIEGNIQNLAYEPSSEISEQTDISENKNNGFEDIADNIVCQKTSTETKACIQDKSEKRNCDYNNPITKQINNSVRLQDIEKLDKCELIEDAEMELGNNRIEHEVETYVIDSLKKNAAEYATDLYDFNLDDIEQSEHTTENQNVDNKTTGIDNSENILPDAKVVKKCIIMDLDKEIEHFDLTHVASDTVVKKRSKLDLIKDKLNNIQPRLSGGPDEIIELDSGITKPNEVTKLMERFVQHTTKKQPHKHNVQLSILTVESGGDIHKETVAMNIGDEEDNTIEEKPGARLQRLREELQMQMAQKKSELWQQKSVKGISGTNPEPANEKQKEDFEMYSDILDDENEEQLTDEDSGEEIEDDVDKTKTKSQFVDYEAEDEDGLNENELASNDQSDNEESENEECYNNSDCEEPKKEIENDHCKSPEIVDIEPKKRKLKRIVEMFDDDSDDDIDMSLRQGIFNKKEEITATKETQDDIPPHQKPKTPIRQTSQFLTPVSYITSIQNLNSSKKKSPGNPLLMANEPSPLKENNWSSNLQKKLFVDNVPDSQELADFCAGKFSYTQEHSQTETDKLNKIVFEKRNHSSQLENEDVIVEAENPSTQDLLNVCSGNFTGVSQILSATNETVEKPPTQVIQLSEISEIKSLGEEQDLISQLIDEEEMENFKMKFNSPENTYIDDTKEIIGGGIVDSDDEDNETILAVKRKNQKALHFSDDDDDSEESGKEDMEEIDLQDDDQIDDVSVENIAYDSEENEYETHETLDRKGDQSEKVKLTDFFEAEAELSESEWGSEDEDEKDLDNFEQEEGDEEKFDENKMRTEIEKIHMRKMLDEDIRDVKMLQELLLEDGEMHGSGRQRQFKWKNIDSTVDGEEGTRVGEDIYFDDEESEEQWRKMRHEREMFLSEKLKNSREECEDIIIESQLLRLGKKVLERNQGHNSQPNTPLVSESEKEQTVLKQPFTLLTKRGSFLSREDQVLERIAEYTKVATCVNIGTAKNSKNFVFQSVSTDTVTQLKKRKAANVEGTPVAIKKLRLSELSPALKKKPEKPDSIKKLFSNNC